MQVQRQQFTPYRKDAQQGYERLQLTSAYSRQTLFNLIIYIHTENLETYKEK